MTAPAAPRSWFAAPSFRAGVLCAAVGSFAAFARAEWRGVPEALAAHQLTVVPGSVRWLDPPGISPRRALLLAHAPEQPSDLFAITAVTGANDRVIRVDDVSNLTRSPNADERGLTVDGRYASFATYVADRAVAFTLVDTAGEHEAPPTDRGARWRTAITRTQQTGQPRGYGFDRFELTTPTPSLTLAFTDHRLVAQLDHDRVAVDPDGAHVREGDALVQAHPRVSAPPDNWLTWAVDTVRAVPWIGPRPIEWAEGVAFTARHAARRAQAAVAAPTVATQQAEVAEDLADVLDVHASGPLEGAVADWPPAPLHPTVQPAIAHEGEWSQVAGDRDPFVQGDPALPPSMYITFLRTDAETPDARAYVVVWDPRQVELHVAPGSQEPIGATGETGTGVIPRDEGTLDRLIGGFNGAFQGLHGEYGVYAEGTLLLPPKPYAATVAAMADGSTGFGSWPADSTEIPPDVLEFRQNLTPLIDQGVFNPWHREDWGPVLNNPADLRTARTGICMTREGYVAFFWGADLSPRELADSMLAARCTYGVHLDMNGANTGFDFYRVGRPEALPPVGHRVQGGYEAEGTVDEMPALRFRARRLVRGMQHQASRYIHRNPRDFFYLLLRPLLPGAPLQPPVAPATPGEGVWHVAGLSDLPFPWPMARTRVRPDAAQPDRWVNLVRLDARRMTLGPPDATGPLVARVVNAQVASAPGALRVTMTQGASGARWAIGTEGTGIQGEPLRAGSATVRGACIDGNGFLVFAVADRAVPDLVSRALTLAGCAEGDPRIAFTGTTLALPSGDAVAGDAASGAHGGTSLTLVAREFAGTRALFPTVTAVPRSVWYPVQSRRVRYFPNPGNNVTVQVRLAGQQPMVFRLPGIGAQFVQQAYPDGGAPPEVPEAH